MNTDKSSLETSRTDIVAAAARGMAGACPVIGGLVADAVNQLFRIKNLIE